MVWDPKFFEKRKQSLQVIPSKTYSARIESFLDGLRSEWKDSMNLYFRNCRHFSGFAKKRAVEVFDVKYVR